MTSRGKTFTASSSRSTSPGARVDELRVEFEEYGDRFAFLRLERKARRYPDASGTIPSVETRPGP
jgi:hypothetical protein